MEVEVQTNGFKVHASHTCDGCSVSPIVGKRFKSSVTAKYNLCSKCFAAYDGDDLFEETLLDRDRKSTKEYVLKIKTNDGPEFTQIRRINVADVWGEDDELSYTKLIAAASKLASIQSGDSTKAKVTYMDGDGDRITISSDVELTDSFRQSIKPRKPFCVTVLFPEENEVKATSAMGIVKNPQKVDNVNLPWSCAIYSVVNWMVAFQDVEGIQIMCLKTLPYLLEDEQQRTTAQRAGLTDNVLHAMVLFPDSIELHTVAFHTLVLLARPLGGNEGMLFHTAMVNTRGIFSNDSTNSKNGIVIMLDSMRRFAQDEILQAMSCWSLVNVALTPLQKSILVKLGGLTVTANAMLQHPYNAEVQFRALFALINLVIPTEPRGPEETEQMREKEREIFQQLGEAGETTEREMLDASVGQITNLVVVAMKNFCSSEAILNRACLVLHNLSFDEAYHGTLLWTPNCYQMLEWCIGNYPHDHVLQQSAGRTLQRLNATLSANEELRVGFSYSELARQPGSCVSTRAAF